MHFLVVAVLPVRRGGPISAPSPVDRGASPKAPEPALIHRSGIGSARLPAVHSVHNPASHAAQAQAIRLLPPLGPIPDLQAGDNAVPHARLEELAREHALQRGVVLEDADFGVRTGVGGVFDEDAEAHGAKFERVYFECAFEGGVVEGAEFGGRDREGAAPAVATEGEAGQ